MHPSIHHPSTPSTNGKLPLTQLGALRSTPQERALRQVPAYAILTHTPVCSSPWSKELSKRGIGGSQIRQLHDGHSNPHESNIGFLSLTAPCSSGHPSTGPTVYEDSMGASTKTSTSKGTATGGMTRNGADTMGDFRLPHLKSLEST